MSRILIVSDAPYHATGYGVQVKHLARLMVEDGHRVFVFCPGAFMGGIVEWEPGVTVVGTGGGDDRWGNRCMNDIADWVKPDVILTWLDVHGMQNYGWTTYPTYAWAPIDTAPVSKPERMILDRMAKVISPSRWGQEILKQHNLDADYVPCGVDIDTYDIDEDGGKTWRKQIDGCDEDTFLIGMVGLNTGSPDRKGYGYAFDILKSFFDRHPQDKITAYLHTDPGGDGTAIPLINLRDELGLADKVAFMPPQLPWGHTELYMRHMYNSFDVMLHTSLTEGFGVPVVEAQACGTPVVANACTSVTELVAGCGGYPAPYLTTSWINTVTNIYIPDVNALLAKLEEAYIDWKARKAAGNLALWREMIRHSVTAYGWRNVYENHWRAALADIPAPINFEEAGGLLGPKLMLGAGRNVPRDHAGWVFHDKDKFYDHIDVAWDLTQFPWPVEDNTYGYIEMEDVLEHLKGDLTEVMDELWRIIKPDGYVYIHTAEAGSWQLMKDPTHVRGFMPDSLDYYDPGTVTGRAYTYSQRQWSVVRRTMDNGGLVFVLQPRKAAVEWVQHFPNGSGEHVPDDCAACGIEREVVSAAG